MNTRRINRPVRWVLTTCFTLAIMLSLAGPARAAGYVVTNLNDSGKGSLRQAILNANASPGADTIAFGVSGTVVLASTLPSIADAAGLTIDGTGQSITISGNDAVRLMWVIPGGVLILRNLTLTGGNSGRGGSGGAIVNDGTLAVSNSTISGNSTDIGGSGGGIANDGTLAVSKSTISGNSANVGGGGISNAGTLTVTDSTVSGNGATNDVNEGGLGGGIRNGGTLTVTNSIFSGNYTYYGYGGAISNVGTLTVIGSTFSGNIAAYGAGAIDGSGPVSVTDSTFSGNSANDAGAISNYASTLTVTNSTFSGNAAHNAGGAIYNYSGMLEVTGSTFSGNSSSINAGAIYNYIAATLTVTNSTFSGNGAGVEAGGIYNLGTLEVTGSTLSENGDRAITNGGYYNTATMNITNSTFLRNGDGGIFNYGALNVTNSTFSENGYTGIFNAPAGTLTVSNSTFSKNNEVGIMNSGTATVQNTIVANSTGGNCFNDSSLADGGGNLSWPDTTCPGLNADPLLRPLQDNGGPTQTLALLPGSPAIDAAVLANCPATDQRGISRPQGAGCDIGAYEFVAYDFSGFFQPVDNLPTWNVVQAGVGVPVRFSLNGNYGLNIFAAGYPVAQKIACTSGQPQDDIEETVIVGSSSLSYDAASDTYTYVWKTSKAWATTCRQLVIRLNDGSEHAANFKFTR